MSDTGLRNLERRWRETGTVDDEARYLLERLRTGELAPERLELAAYVGHEPARVALGDAAPSGQFAHFARWAQAVDPAGKVALVQAAVAGARVLLRQLGRGTVGEPIGQALAELDAWCACPCREHEEQLRGVRGELEGSQRELLEAQREHDPRDFFQLLALRRAGAACDAVSTHLGGRPSEALLIVMKEVSTSARLGEGEGRGREAIATPLLSWTLGGDHELRCLARSPAETLQEDARYLAERVRAGELERDALELAAYAGDPAAQAVLGARAPAGSEDPIAWLRGLERWGPTVLRRAVLVHTAWTELYAAFLQAEFRPRNDGEVVFHARARRLLHATSRLIRSWLERPGPAQARALDDFRRELAERAISPILDRAPNARAVLAAAEMALACDGTSAQEAAAAVARLTALDEGGRVQPPVRLSLIHWALAPDSPRNDPALRADAP